MSAELTVGAFISKFWGAIAGVVGVVVGFLVSHVRLEAKFESYRVATDAKLAAIESGISRDLVELKNDVKELRHLHIALLERLSEKTK